MRPRRCSTDPKTATGCATPTKLASGGPIWTVTLPGRSRRGRSFWPVTPIWTDRTATGAGRRSTRFWRIRDFATRARRRAVPLMHQSRRAVPTGTIKGPPHWIRSIGSMIPDPATCGSITFCPRRTFGSPGRAFFGPKTPTARWRRPSAPLHATAWYGWTSTSRALAMAW